MVPFRSAGGRAAKRDAERPRPPEAPEVDGGPGERRWHPAERALLQEAFPEVDREANEVFAALRFLKRFAKSAVVWVPVLIAGGTWLGAHLWGNRMTMIEAKVDRNELQNQRRDSLRADEIGALMRAVGRLGYQQCVTENRHNVSERVPTVDCQSEFLNNPFNRGTTP